jgi:hypothetical protein
MPSNGDSCRAERLHEAHARSWTEFRTGQRGADVIDDCRGGSAYWRSAPQGVGVRSVGRAVAYVLRIDRARPFSFENLRDRLGLDAGALRKELIVLRASV